MTPNKKLKIICYPIVISILLFITIGFFDKLVFNLPQEQLDKYTTSIEQRIEKSVIEFDQPTIPSGNILVITDLLKELPKDTLVVLISGMDVSELQFIDVFWNSIDIEQRHWVIKLFKHLNGIDLKRLISIIEKVGIKRAMLLVDKLLVMPLNIQKEMIEVLSDFPLTNIVKFIYLLDNFNDSVIEKMVEVLSNSSNIRKLFDFLLEIPYSYYEDLFDVSLSNHPRLIDLYVSIVKELDIRTIENSLKVFIRMDNRYRNRLLQMVHNLPNDKKSFVINSFVDMSDIHIERSIEIIEQDKRILDKSINLGERLEKHLSRGEFVNTVERSVNTASRVDKENRYKGLDILQHDVRAVPVRRLMKQVDGHQNVYTGNTIVKMISDYDTIEQPNKFVNIITSSDGLIHGFYRQVDKYVSQERKLEVINLVYNGEKQNKREFMLDFYDTKSPIVIHKKENDFVVDIPKELE